MDAVREIEAMTAEEKKAAMASREVVYAAATWRLKVALSDAAADLSRTTLIDRTRANGGARMVVSTAVADLANAGDALDRMLERQLDRLTEVQKLLVEELL